MTTAKGPILSMKSADAPALNSADTPELGPQESKDGGPAPNWPAASIPIDDTLGQGRTHISAKALATVARAVIADQFSLPYTLVKISLFDSHARLGVRADMPVSTAMIRHCRERSIAVTRLCDCQRRQVAAQIYSLTRHDVSQVDFHLTGISAPRIAATRRGI